MKNKKRRLKKWVKVVIWGLVLLAYILLISMACDNYMEHLQQCDTIKGYTCNIFGK